MHPSELLKKFNMALRSSIGAEVNRELEQLLASNPPNTAEVVGLIKKRVVEDTIRQYLKVIIGLAILYTAFQYIPCINDNVHAICRLTFTTIVLPLFKCEHLYVDRCLVAKGSTEISYSDDVGASYDHDELQCAVCEGLGEWIR